MTRARDARKLIGINDRPVKPFVHEKVDFSDIPQRIANGTTRGAYVPEPSWTRPGSSTRHIKSRGF